VSAQRDVVIPVFTAEHGDRDPGLLAQVLQPPPTVGLGCRGEGRGPR
jgi:hypothetical protein